MLIGGHADAVMRRLARIGDGWFPLFEMNDEGKGLIDKLHRYIEEAGRHSSEVGIETFINVSDKTSEQYKKEIADWKNVGATHISVNTMGANFTSLADHIEAVKEFRDVADSI